MKQCIFPLSLLALTLCSAPVVAQSGYQKPPQEVLDVLNAPLPPSAYRSPDNRAVLFAQWMRYPAIADLAQPMLRLAGIRINPRTNGQSSNRTYITGLSLKALPDGAERPITLPADVRLSAPLWNATATMFAFTNEAVDGIELWVGEVATTRVRRLAGVKLNPLLGSSIQWMADQRTLLVKSVPPGRGAPPAAPSVPPGPKIQES